MRNKITELLGIDQKLPVRRFMGMPPNADSEGDIELRSLLAGQGVGLINEINSAAEIVRELIEGAHQIIKARAAEW